MAELRTGIIIQAKAGEASKVLDDLRKKFGELGQSAKQSDAAGGQFQNTRTALQGLSGELSRVRAGFLSLIGVTAAGLGAQQIIATADAYTNLSARLKLVTGGQQEFNASFQALSELANRTLSPLQETAQAFVRIQPAVKNLGGTYRETLALTEAVSLSLRVSGASAAEQASALLQFAQGLSSNFQGDEFRALTESAPRLMQAVADGMGRNVTELKAMSAAGKLTADVVGNALIKSLQQLRSEASGIPPTVSGAFQVLQNEALKYVGNVDQARGASSTLAQAILTLGQNFTVVANTAVTLGAAIAAIGFGRLVTSIQASIAATLQAVAADRAAAAAKAALAAADLKLIDAERAAVAAKVASAQAIRAHAAALVVNAEAAIANATGMQRLALVTSTLIPSQQRLAQANAQLTASYAALSATQQRQAAAQVTANTAQAAAATGGSAVGTVLGRILGILGGPVGIIASLGLAAAAWLTFRDKGVDAVGTLEQRVARARAELQKFRDDREAIDSGVEPKVTGERADDDPAVKALFRSREALEQSNRQIISGQQRVGGVHDREIKQIDEQIAKSRELAKQEKTAIDQKAREQAGFRPLESAISTEEASKGLQTRTAIIREHADQVAKIQKAFDAAQRKSIEEGNEGRAKALQQERDELIQSANKQRDQALKGLAGPAAAGPQQRLPTLREEFDAIFRLTKDGLDREKEALELSQKDQLISIGAFFAERRRIADDEAANDLARLDREKTAQEKLIADLTAARTRTRGGAEGQSQREQIDDQVFSAAQKVKEINTEIQVVQGRRLAEGRKLASEQAAAETQLADQLAQVRDRMAEIAGVSGGQEVRDRLLRQFKPLLDELTNAGRTGDRDAVLRTINAEGDLAELRKLEEQFNAAMSRMRTAEESINIKRQAGLLSESQARQFILKLHQDTAAEVERLIPGMEELTAKIPGNESQNRVAGLKVEFERLKTVVDDVALAINGAVRDGFEGLFTDIATGAKTAKQAILDFARSIEQAITKIAAREVSDQLFGGTGTGGAGGIVSKLLKGGFSLFGSGASAGSGFASGFSGIAELPFLHSGGIAGRDGERRAIRIDPLAFIAAPRYHAGGIGGLAPNEVPAILERGEEVLTRGDPRHRMNGARATTIVNIQTPDIAGFRRGRTQWQADIASAVARGKRNQ